MYVYILSLLVITLILKENLEVLTAIYKIPMSLDLNSEIQMKVCHTILWCVDLDTSMYFS